MKKIKYKASPLYLVPLFTLHDSIKNVFAHFGLDNNDKLLITFLFQFMKKYKDNMVI